MASLGTGRVTPAEAARDLTRAAARTAVELSPLGLALPAWHVAAALWRDYLLTFPDPTAPAYALAYRAWPAAALAGPALLTAIALAARRLGRAGPAAVLAGLAGTALATLLTLRPEWDRLAPHLGRASVLDLVHALDPAVAYAGALGFLAVAAGVRALRSERVRPADRPHVTRAASDNHGHADWMPMGDARRLFPGPDPDHGGIVVGEAYRVDQDRGARGPFDPADPRSWGKGGTAPLLVDPCRTGPTHALVLAGSGGLKTTAVAVPTLLTWTGAAVVLDPSRELGPMLANCRERELGHEVVTLDPTDPASGAFDALDWIDPAAPLAEADVEAVATWLAGEPPRGAAPGGAEFFRDAGKALIACVLADVLWDPTPGADRTLRRVRRVLVTPEEEMRALLRRVHAGSPAPLARDLAGTLMGLVPETFSGVYANADQATRWLSTKAFADLVSGRSFRTRDLCGGRLTVFVQVPLKVLQSTPGLGRVVVGALLNAVHEADGRVQGRVLFLLDEAARLGPMAALESARDAGRKYGLTLLLLYQSAGQLVEQWGREGARAWHDSTSWRMYAAVQDPETARELSAVCGRHGVVATSRGASTSGRGGLGGLAGTSAGRSESRSELGRALVGADEILQDARADEAFVVVRGGRPLRCGRAVYFRRPGMLARVARNRFAPAAAGEG